MSVLKRSVFWGIFLLALIPESYSACYHEILNPGVTHCKNGLDMTWHPIGSSWKNSACQKCWCMAGEMRCCDGWPTSSSGGCTIKYDYRTCTYQLIHTDKSIPCSAIG